MEYCPMVVFSSICNLFFNSTFTQLAILFSTFHNTASVQLSLCLQKKKTAELEKKWGIELTRPPA